MIMWSPRRGKIASIVVAAAVTSMLATAPEASAAPAESAADSTTEDAAHGVGSRHTVFNKALVTFVYDQLFNHGNLSVIDTFISADYIQHNPNLADGREPLRQFVASVHANFPQNRNAIVRVLGDGDLVLIHSHATRVPGTKGQSIIDVFRVADGKIVEHWDVLQAVPDSTVSGNDMFTTLSDPQIDGPDPLAHTARSKQTALGYFSRMSDDHDLTAIDQYLGGAYYQHDPNLPNGIAAAKAAYAFIFATYPGFTATSLKVVAEGDLVAVRYHYKTSPEDRGQAIVDMFRVRNGKIVEHWDVAQDIPATSANDNTMF